MLQQIMKAIPRRTRVVSAFPDGQSARLLDAARLRHVSGTKWRARRYLDMDRLTEMYRDDEHKETGPYV